MSLRPSPPPGTCYASAADAPAGSATAALAPQQPRRLAPASASAVLRSSASGRPVSAGSGGTTSGSNLTPPTRPGFLSAPLHSAAPPCAVALQRPVSAWGAAASPLHSAPLRESPVLPVARPAQPAPAFRVLPPALRPPRMTFVPRPCARASVPPVACFSSGQKASVANTLLCRALYCLWLHGMAAILFTAFTTPSG